MEGISHLVIEVSALKRAEDFYREVLGFESGGDRPSPDCGRSVSLRAASGQWLVLAETPEPRSLPETGVHQAYRIARFDREAIQKKLAARGVNVDRIGPGGTRLAPGAAGSVGAGTAARAPLPSVAPSSRQVTTGIHTKHRAIHRSKRKRHNPDIM